MLGALKDLQQEIAPQHDSAAGSQRPSLRLAAAVLLIEVMRASDGISVEERVAAARFLAEQFELPPEEMKSLLDQGERESIAAYDFFRFTNPLDETLPQDRKIALVQAMWNVAYADGDLDSRENAVISKVADLLHVSHGDYIAAKMRASSARRE